MSRSLSSASPYPRDSDLAQMTDDGCPHTPDPARWADAEWRDAFEDRGPARISVPRVANNVLFRFAYLSFLVVLVVLVLQFLGTAR